MAIILLDNNKSFVYVPDCSLPEELFDPAKEVIEDEIKEESYLPKQNQYGCVKREREESPENVDREKPAGVWAKGIGLRKASATSNKKFRKF